MYQLILTKQANNAWTRDELYLAFQTMKIINFLKTPYWSLQEINKQVVSDFIEKMTIELVLIQGAYAYEVLHRLFDSKRKAPKTLFERYREVFKDPATLYALEHIRLAYGHKDELGRKDEAIRVLCCIRNEHSFHIATESEFVWESYKEETVNQDIPIGISQSNEWIDSYFTLDSDYLFGYIRDNILTQTDDVREHVQKIVANYTYRLNLLFSMIAKEMFEGRVDHGLVP